MSNRKITDMAALTTPASDDVLPIVDVSETAAVDKNKKITIDSLFTGVPGNVTLAGGYTTTNGVTIQPSIFRVRDDNGSLTNAGLAIYRGGSTSSDIVARINYNGSATFADSLQTGDYDLTDAAANGTRVGSGIVYAKRASTNNTDLFRGYKGTDIVFKVEDNGAAEFDSRVKIATATEGHANADELTLASTANCGLTIRSGSTSSGNIYFSDTNTGTGEYSGYIAYDHQDNRMMFAVNDSEAMRIINNGNVGIGETNPGAGLHVKVDTNPVLVINRGSANTTNFNLQYNGTTTGQLSAANGLFNISAVGSSTPIGIYTNGSERMVIDSGGAVTINNLAGTGNRAVYSNASGVLTNSSSDVTLKTDVATLAGQIEVVKQLNPVAYNWIDTEGFGEQREIGFIAQEIKPLIPEVVGVNNDETLSVDYPKITAVLTKALQEAIAKIETLEIKVAALEAG